MIVGFILLSVACKSNTKKKLPQELYKIQTSFNEEDSTGYENMILRLYEDGTYSHFAVNYYSFGIWKWSDSLTRLLLIPKQSNKDMLERMFEMERLSNDSFNVKRLRKNGVKLMRDKIPAVFWSNKNNSNYDPFSLANNSWRIKPQQPETLIQIRNRTLKYLYFLKTYYLHAIDNKSEMLTLGWYPTPIQMHYGNGARMAYNTELRDWNACFYNEEQAVEGYKLISGTMRTVTVHKKDTKPLRNLDLVEQIISIVEKLPTP
jgi:hypothetical protein